LGEGFTERVRETTLSQQKSKCGYKRASKPLEIGQLNHSMIQIYKTKRLVCDPIECDTELGFHSSKLSFKKHQWIGTY